MNDEQTTETVEQNNSVVLLQVSFNTTDGNYSVSLPKGMSVNETVFCMSVVARCFLRDGVIKDKNEVVDLLKKYLDDPQWEEVKDGEPVNNDNNS